MTAVAILRQEESSCLPLTTSDDWLRLCIERRWFRDGALIKDEWVPPPLFWAEPMHQVPHQGACDFLDFATGSVALSDRAVRALDKVWTSVGEILPVGDEGVQSYSVLNVTRVIPALNAELTQGLKGERGNFLRIRKYVFIDELVESELVFKVPGQGAIYCTERFAELVTEAALTGTWFKKVWRSRASA